MTMKTWKPFVKENIIVNISYFLPWTPASVYLEQEEPNEWHVHAGTCSYWQFNQLIWNIIFILAVHCTLI